MPIWNGMTSKKRYNNRHLLNYNFQISPAGGNDKWQSDYYNSWLTAVVKTTKCSVALLNVQECDAIEGDSSNTA
jgi:hypothetical protein